MILHLSRFVCLCVVIHHSVYPIITPYCLTGGLKHACFTNASWHRLSSSLQCLHSLLRGPYFLSCFFLVLLLTCLSVMY